MLANNRCVNIRLYLFSIKMDPHSQLSISFNSFSSHRPTPASRCVSLMCVEFHAVHRAACCYNTINVIIKLSNTLSDNLVVRNHCACVCVCFNIRIFPVNLRLETGLSQAVHSLKKEGILDGLSLVSTDRVFVRTCVCFPGGLL